MSIPSWWTQIIIHTRSKFGDRNEKMNLQIYNITCESIGIEIIIIIR